MTDQQHPRQNKAALKDFPMVGGAMTPSGGDPADLVTDLFGEPEVAIGTGGDPVWDAAGGRDRELSDDSQRG